MSLRLTGQLKNGFWGIATLCMLCIWAVDLHAQSYSSVNYNTKDGLPSTTVYDLAQDNNGFIWFATENGLCWFDGKNFRTYTTKDGLPDNSVMKVHVDKTGRVYFAPFMHGLYYYANDSFFKVPIPEKYQADLAHIVRFANNGNRVVLTGAQHSYILENNQLVSLADRYKKSYRLLYARAYDTLMILQSDDSVFYAYESGRMTAELSYHKNNLGLVYNTKGEGVRLRIPKGSTYVPQIYIGEGDLISGGSDDVVEIYDLNSRDKVYEIGIEKPSNVMIDNEANLWITTLGHGVYRFPSFRFRNMRFDGKSEIFSIEKWNQQIVAGTDFSRMYIFPDKAEPLNYQIADFTEFINRSGNTPARLYNLNRTYLLRSFGSELYVATDAFLLKKKGSAAPVFSGLYPLKDVDLADKKILVCTGYAVFELNEDDLSMRDTLLNQRATCGAIYQGDYYVGTLGGLTKISGTDKKVTALYKSFPEFRGRITSIRKGPRGDLWVATSGSGLVRFRNGSIIDVVNEEDGLTSDICTSLFIDSNFVWLGTDKGLNRIAINSEKPAIVRITSANGLGADFINAVYVTDSTIYVGTAMGITTFGKDVMKEKSICLLHILQVSANNTRLKPDSHYSFAHDALNIQIDFTAVSFKSAGDITYYYQLKGLDQQWNTTTANAINFPTLAPGGYTLMLRAVNKFGEQSDVKTIDITIRPPWWQAWTFRIAAILLLISLVAFIFWYNVRNIKRKEKVRREIEVRFAALEQRALQAQMNPHFIFNCLNSIQNFILNLDVEGANNYLTSFASLIRQTLENSMQPYISIAHEVKYLETYLRLEKLRFRDKFNFEIDVDLSINQTNTLLPAMLLQPYVENSIRHGIQHRKDNKGSIVLHITKGDDNSVNYMIRDNGVGRERAQALKSSRHIEYQSRGTHINKNRIMAINSQLNTHIRVSMEDVIGEDGAVAGTMVTVVIPPLKISQ